MHRTRVLLIVALAAMALTMACGDSNPASPSGTGGVSVEGVMLSEGAAFTSSSSDSEGPNDGPVTVMVEGTPISVTISGNGTFKLEDVPAGTFTLVFLQGGVQIGSVTVTAPEGAQVKVMVKKQGSILVVVDLEIDGEDGEETTKTCLINGGRSGDKVELEGNVSSGGGKSFELTVNGNRASGPVTVEAGGATFKCNGKTGDGPGGCEGAVAVGAKVHVRGTLNSCTTSQAVVQATEVKVQKAAK